MAGGLALDNRRVWIAGAAVVALLIVAAAWFLAIDPKRSDTQSIRTQTSAAETQNNALEQQNLTLTRQSRHLPVYQAALAKVLAVLPAQSDLAVFSRSITHYAAQTGVHLTSISVGTPAPVAAATTPTPTDSTATTSGSDSSTTEPTVAPTTAAATGPMSTSFTLQATGTLPDELAFLNAVRTGSRAALVTSTQFTSAAGKDTLTAQVNVFSSQMPAGELQQLRRLLQPAK